MRVEGSVFWQRAKHIPVWDLLTNSLSHGNSGGALIDNEGFVIGVTTWGHEVEQYNGAVSLDAFCEKILECEYEFDGEKTWWDYSNE